ncbi:MAG: D-alanine--D-alanine ligase [Bacteroidales bacterium]|nr:D-alanine--D-alanine ligase [Bacteroidales bacterium]
MQKPNIAVITGGHSGEYEIAVQSGENIYAQLDKARFNVFLILMKGNSWSYRRETGETVEVDKNDFSLPLPQGRVRFDAVFIAIHGTPGENGKLQGYFDMLGIPYVGCKADISALTFNKHLCNTYLKAYDVRMTDAVHLYRHEKADPDALIACLGLPCFVKPCGSGSSVGVTKVKRAEDLQAAMEEAFVYDEELLVERFVPGRELACGVVALNRQPQVIAITEICPKKDFFDYEAKYQSGLSDEITPADIPAALQKQCEEESLRIYKALGCSGIVRIDYIANETGLYFIEVNTIPGQTSGSIVPKQLAYRGWSFSELCTKLLEETLAQPSPGGK